MNLWRCILIGLIASAPAVAQTAVPASAGRATHWSFVVPRGTAVPDVGNLGWVNGAIDRFILRRLESEGLKPSPAADAGTLLRRVTLDLTGLPPTAEEVDGFVSDSSPRAYEKVVDRLLASPRYGERMALAWLDAARYADTNGYNNDEDRTMWPWRDWVIDAFNRNLPYDRFILEQIAGDLVPGSTLSQQVATAFLRNQGHNTEGGIIPEEYRVEYVADRVHTAATLFLGLSMQCARCHDHKFDPISQKEYYRFYAFFNTMEEKQASYVNFKVAEPFVKVPSAEQKQQLQGLEDARKDLERQVAQREAEVLQNVSHLQEEGIPLDLHEAEQKQIVQRLYLNWIDRDYARLKSALADCLRRKAELEEAIPSVMVLREMAEPRQTFLLTRGQYDKPADPVSADVPAFLPPLLADAPKNRLGLARWLVDPSNPLTARVAVNRLWQQIFGAGLVRTVEDFGTTGEAPSHPELLDYLAVEFVRSGWDVKAMLRQMVLSATYRQSSRLTPQLETRDPENRLMARSSRYRLPAEVIRDNALAVSGLLVDKIGGPSVKPYQPEGLWEDVTVNRRGRYVVDTGDGLYRRSLYTFWKRTCPPPALATFDAPNREVCVARRATTNTPLQAMVLMNDTTYVEAARVLAQHLLAKDGSDSDRLDDAFRRTLARRPGSEEREILLSLYNGAKDRFSKDPSQAAKLTAAGRVPRDAAQDPRELAAWTVVCSTLLNLDETISKR